MTRKRTKSALRSIARDVGKNPKFRRMVEEEKLNARIAQMIYDARTKATLT
ncbi:MAG: hypothetical protein HYR85_23725 [Planctomycetes bacterium]|nr:hypothetical protein [Planctomycetota bacterium]MBI3848377.1 hypothetical protein [Planctomycetota bacterium]